jgi:Ca2+-binding RTX toxin-like protein
VASVTMNLDQMESIEFNAAGGTDNIVFNDMSGTDLVEVTVDLAGTIGSDTPDNVADTITITGTQGDDVIQLVAVDGDLMVFGLATWFVIENFDANDTVRINGLDGDDVIEASGVTVTNLNLHLDGGNGNDVIIGGSGNDVLLGGAGDDVLLGGGGLDVIDGGLGDNIAIQGAIASSGSGFLIL